MCKKTVAVAYAWVDASEQIFKHIGTYQSIEDQNKEQNNMDKVDGKQSTYLPIHEL